MTASVPPKQKAGVALALDATRYHVSPARNRDSLLAGGPAQGSQPWGAGWSTGAVSSS